MNPKSTRYWIAATAVLLVLLLVNQRFGPKPVSTAPPKVLGALDPAEVTAIQVLPKGQPAVRADRTKGLWLLTEPLAFPAQTARIDALLSALQNLTPAVYITAQERKHRPKADEEDGFLPPFATVVLHQGNDQRRINIGAKTAPGDQVFLQVVGVEGVYVVDAGLLELVPSSANEWRDPILVNLQGLNPDRVAVNGPKIFELLKDPAAQLWRVLPIQARADSAKIEDLLKKLGEVQATRFVSDSPAPDLEALGLQPPALQVTLGQGSNTLALLQFGKSPTNDSTQIYARRFGQNTIVTVPKESLAPWLASSANDFRDPYLVTLTGPVAAIEVAGEENFAIRLGTNGTWRLLPRDLPADAGFVKGLVSALSGLRIVEFTKDVVTEPDFAAYGLASPRRKYTLRPPDAAPGATNAVLAELHFGTNREDTVYVRRTGESSVYAVRLADFQRLPSRGLEFRERQIWDVAENEIAGVTIRQAGKVRKLVRNGPHEWSLAPGSQGVIDPIAVEETVRMLGRLAADYWVGQGEESRAQAGITENNHRIAIGLRSGGMLAVEFAPEMPGRPQYAAVTLGETIWVFEFPLSLYRFVATYLVIPADVR